VCSSTLVRKAIQVGACEQATRLLGRYPELEGEVVHGAGRGRSIGVPTANLRCTTEVMPAVGVYAAWAELLEPEAPAAPIDAEGRPVTPAADAEVGLAEARPRRVLLRRPAAVNVGYNPTFTSPRGDSPVSHTALDQQPISPVAAISVEAHLLGDPTDPPLPSLYGQTLRLQFVSRVRSEKKFPSVAALVEQIGNDITTVRQRLVVQR
jgi:riboflavin kinase/FMN adenylyltransferase